MRVSTNQMQLTAISSMIDRQSDLSHTQLQVATGKRVVNPSDDPVASASLLNLEQSRSQTERFQVNADAARARLSIEEGILSSVTEQIHRVRELAIHANNSHITTEDRSYIAKEVRHILDEIIALANSTDNNNQYLFSGNQGKTKPFSTTATGVRYDGDGGQRLLQVGSGRRVADADPGNEVFMNIMNGNGDFYAQEDIHTGSGVIHSGTVVDRLLLTQHDYTITYSDTTGDTIADEFVVVDNVTGGIVLGPSPYVEGDAVSFDGIQVTVQGAPADGDTFTITPSVEQSLFTTLNDLIQTMERPATGDTSGARMINGINRALYDLDQSLDNILNTRAAVGARLNAIDDQSANNENFILQVEESISVLNDLDYAEAISRLNLQMAGLEASQKAYTRIQGLSLFNYI